MEQEGDKHGSAVSSDRSGDQMQFDTKRRLAIHNCFRQPTTLSLLGLQRWHEDYKAADGRSLSSKDAVIQEAQSDELNTDAIEECIAELAKEVRIKNGLCDDCRHMFDNWPNLGDPEAKDPTTGLHWPGSGADWKHAVARDSHTLIFETAARNGCRFCALVVQTMRDANLLDTVRRVEARLECIGDNSKTSLSVQNWGRNSSQLLWLNFPGKISDHCNDGIAAEVNFESAALEISADTYDEPCESLDIAKTWLETCSDSHEDCDKTAQDVLPNRLISIANIAPRLVLTAGWETKPRYSTLSHRWGAEGFLKLTTNNYDSFLTSIPIEELPKTFIDAIYISRRLGLQYLWIDSLCIIQGDAEDWRREAGLMSSVYGGSFVNIAAASAVNVYQGCFLKPPYLVDGLRASINVNGGKLVRDFRNRSAYEQSTINSHLATRAWALQEKILPPRTIHFGNRGAYWECRTMIANEFLPGGFPHQLGSGLIKKREREESVESFHSWWSKVVQIYSAANLTFNNDKLPAIAGVARRTYNERGKQYLAGMWKDDQIEAQLRWQVTEPRKRPPWRAPSWSWASVDGQVRYLPTQSGVLEDMYAHVLDAEMTLLSDDPFGEVRGGQLRITCSGMLAARISNHETIRFEADDEDFPISPDCLDDQEESGDGIVYLVPLLGGRSGAASVAPGYDIDNDDDDEVEEKWIHEMSICGILLWRTSGAPGQFYRFGTFEYQKDRAFGRKGEKELYEPFLRAFEHKGGTVAESVCEEVIENMSSPDETYVISII